MELCTTNVYNNRMIPVVNFGCENQRAASNRNDCNLMEMRFRLNGSNLIGQVFEKIFMNALLNNQLISSKSNSDQYFHITREW